MITEIKKITFDDLEKYLEREMSYYKHSNKNVDPKDIYLGLKKILNKVEAVEYWERNKKDEQ